MFPNPVLPWNFLFRRFVHVSIYIIESRFDRLRHVIKRFFWFGQAREIDIKS